MALVAIQVRKMIKAIDNHDCFNVQQHRVLKYPSIRYRVASAEGKNLAPGSEKYLYQCWRFPYEY